MHCNWREFTFVPKHQVSVQALTSCILINPMKSKVHFFSPSQFCSSVVLFRSSKICDLPFISNIYFLMALLIIIQNYFSFFLELLSADLLTTTFLRFYYFYLFSFNSCQSPGFNFVHVYFFNPPFLCHPTSFLSSRLQAPF